MTLREVRESDLEVFFQYQLDAEAIHMAAFTSKDPTDRSAFDAHWAKLFANDSIINRTIDVDGNPAGYLGCFEQEGDREICYWIGREFWGKGIASQALSLFLSELEFRPIFARAAKDNLGSIRVMEKCGFVLVGEDRGFANARQAEIDEVVMKLR